MDSCLSPLHRPHPGHSPGIGGGSAARAAARPGRPAALPPPGPSLDPPPQTGRTPARPQKQVTT